MPITKEDIKTLCAEARAAGDKKMVAICQRALLSGPSSEEWGECEHVIAMNRANHDGEEV